MPPRVPNGRPSIYAFCEVSCGASNTASVGAVSVPIASRLILPAADRYASMSAGEVVSVPAMLSNPWLESSEGRNVVASMLRPSRSRIAFVYSVRFRRCRPGAGRYGAASLSISLSSHAARSSRLSRSSVGPPSAGGIRPERSLRTTFSQVSACVAMESNGSASRFRPATCSAALWQSRQIPLTTAAWRSPSLPMSPQPDASRLVASAAAPRPRVLRSSPVVTGKIVTNGGYSRPPGERIAVWSFLGLPAQADLQGCTRPGEPIWFTVYYTDFL